MYAETTAGTRRRASRLRSAMLTTRGKATARASAASDFMTVRSAAVPLLPVALFGLVSLERVVVIAEVLAGVVDVPRIPRVTVPAFLFGAAAVLRPGHAHV